MHDRKCLWEVTFELLLSGCSKWQPWCEPRWPHRAGLSKAGSNFNRPPASMYTYHLNACVTRRETTWPQAKRLLDNNHEVWWHNNQPLWQTDETSSNTELFISDSLCSIHHTFEYASNCIFKTVGYTLIKKEPGGCTFCHVKPPTTAFILKLHFNLVREIHQVYFDPVCWWLLWCIMRLKKMKPLVF